MKPEYVTDAGDGPAILMVHGWGQTRTAFAPLADSLKENFRVISFDLAGHGSAKSEPGPYTFERYREDIQQLAGELKLEKFNLLGWSMGGTIAAGYCLEGLSPKPESLILLSATPRFRANTRNLGEGQHPAAIKKMEQMLKADPETALRGFIGLFFESGEAIDDKDKALIEKALMSDNLPPNGPALIETLAHLAQADLTGAPGEYDGPVLIIHGTLDKICPSGGQKLWNSRFDKIESQTLESAGHAPHLTRTGEVAQSITHFISGT